LDRGPSDWEAVPVRINARFLAPGFSERDKARMHDVAARNQSGALSAAERDELLGYAKAGCLLGILRSKARRALKGRQATHGRAEAP
jgi:hypothetical protein